MAGFCVSCGNPLADGAKFCNKCGATQPAAQAGAVIPPAPAAPAAKGSNTAVKIIIGILAFFRLSDAGGGGWLCIFRLPG